MPTEPANQHGSLTTAVLATAQIKLHYNDFTTPNIRCLCDSGAQINLITLKCALDSRLKIHPSSEQIVGIGGTERVIGVTFARIYDRHSHDINLPARFIVITKIALNLPSAPLEVHTKGIVDDDKLADAQFKTPGTIDALLGAGIWARIVRPGLSRLEDGLTAQLTELGWLVFGENAEEEAMHCHMLQASPDSELNKALERLWRSDEVEPHNQNMTPEDKWCEDNFNSTHHRDASGRYVTTLSLKPDDALLGQSYQAAAQRFASL